MFQPCELSLASSTLRVFVRMETRADPAAHQQFKTIPPRNMLKSKWLNLAPFFLKDQPSKSSARTVTKSRQGTSASSTVSAQRNDPHRDKSRHHPSIEEYPGGKRQSYDLSATVPSDFGGQQDRAFGFPVNPTQEHPTKATASGVLELCLICGKYPGPVAWLVSEDTDRKSV